MERKTVARWLLVFAFACFGLLFAGASAQAQENVVSGTQSSFGSQAATGATLGANQSTFGAGPTATGAVSANSQQLGSNRGTVSQSTEAKSGDPVAGGQVTGAVADDVTVQNSNTAIAPQAVSGPVLVLNSVATNVGPQAAAPLTAQTSQVGSNSADVSQSTVVETGDAVAGAQVTGIVGGGEHTVQNQNFAAGAVGVSGVALVLNNVTTGVGPTALALGPAQTSQVGDNDAVLSQSTELGTGDALASAQVTGIVGGSATVQNSNASPFQDIAVSGLGILSNNFTTTVGPTALSAAITGQASQTGDNTVDAAQDVQASTGDALAGSQVTGAVGDQGGFLVVQNQQASSGDVAFSGPLLAGGIAGIGNNATLTAGPLAFGAVAANVSQNGDNDVAFAQAVETESGDALAGAQVTGAVGHRDVTVANSNAAFGNIAVSGLVISTPVSFAGSGPTALSGGFASASQLGNNASAVSQDISSATGDAVSGGQVTGVVATDNADVTIANQNAGIGNIAFSGPLFAIHLAFTNTGPFVLGGFSGQASQTGDNTTAVAQTVESSTGDAVSAGQVTGVVAGGHSDVTVANQNSAFLNIGVTGQALVANVLQTGAAPQVTGGISATVSQVGDNQAAVLQSAEAETGDAVTGAQVTGAVVGGGAGHSVTISNSNTSLANFSITGQLTALNVATTNAAPSALSQGFASASQVGSNGLDFVQELATGTGDAVAGSQVNGVVGTRSATIQIQNSDLLSQANSGVLIAFNNAAGTLNASAVGAFAQASQAGDTNFAGGQDLSTESGDALAGAQVSGDVGASGHRHGVSRSTGTATGVAGT